jgi:inactive STAND/Effector-associated domain 9
MSTSRKDYLQNQLKQKKQDLKQIVTTLSFPQEPVYEGRLKNQAEFLLTEIESLEDQLKQMSFNQSEDHWNKHFYKINYKETNSKILNTLESFSDTSAAALFLIQYYHDYCGEYYITHLKNSLDSYGTINRPYHVEFEISPAPSDFIIRMGGSGADNTLEENTINLIQNLYKSLGNHSILFIQINLDLTKPDNDFLEWLVQDFWCKLIKLCPHGVKVIGVLAMDEDFPEELKDTLCCHDQNTVSNKKLLPLPQEQWQEDEVYNWICRFSLLDRKYNFREIVEWSSIKVNGNERCLRYPNIIKNRLLKRMQVSISSP